MILSIPLVTHTPPPPTHCSPWNKESVTYAACEILHMLKSTNHRINAMRTHTFCGRSVQSVQVLYARTTGESKYCEGRIRGWELSYLEVTRLLLLRPLLYCVATFRISGWKFETHILYLNISSCTSSYVSSHVLSSPAAVNKLLVRRSCPRRPIEITAAHLSGKCVSSGLILRPRWRPFAPFSVQSQPRTRTANATHCSSDAPILIVLRWHIPLSSRCSNVDSQAKHHHQQWHHSKIEEDASL